MLHYYTNKSRIFIMEQMIKVDKIEFVANKLKSLSHPLRVKIINLLKEKDKLTVTEIQKYLKIEQAATSHHLKILKYEDVLNDERDGRKKYYSLKRKDIWKEINRFVDKFND